MDTILKPIQNFLVSQYNIDEWMSPHAIDLHAHGVILPHVDSVRFSGAIVSGLSLKASCTMRLQQEASVVDLTLPTRSLYVLSGPGRYDYTHEIRGLEQQRYSIIFRDALKVGLGSEWITRKLRINALFGITV